jgi:hypothetical protein
MGRPSVFLRFDKKVDELRLVYPYQKSAPDSREFFLEELGVP